jgi:hypothetical protein
MLKELGKSVVEGGASVTPTKQFTPVSELSGPIVVRTEMVEPEKTLQNSNDIHRKKPVYGNGFTVI